MPYLSKLLIFSLIISKACELKLGLYYIMIWTQHMMSASIAHEIISSGAGIWNKSISCKAVKILVRIKLS